MNRQTATVIAVGVALFAIVLGWEHVGRINKSASRPSAYLQVCADEARDFFYHTGVYIAWLVGGLIDYIYVHAQGIVRSLVELLAPVFALIIAPFHIIRGYVYQAGLFVWEWAAWLPLFPLFIYGAYRVGMWADEYDAQKKKRQKEKEEKEEDEYDASGATRTTRRTSTRRATTTTPRLLDNG